MQFITVLLALATASMATPTPEIEVELEARNASVAAANCGSGYSIQTFGSENCGQFEQGVTNTGSGCVACVQMGNAKSWRVINPSRCSKVNVGYYHDANCPRGQLPVRTVTYDVGAQPCQKIPTDIGDHFSAQFSCGV